MFDLVLVGGGLANGLIAWRLVNTRPDVSFALIESGPTLGGTQTWSFCGTHVTKAQLEWLWVLGSKSWPSHDVRFCTQQPHRVGGGFHSIRSDDFHWKLMEQLKDRVRLKAKAITVTATQVTLASGEALEARAIIDGRGSPAIPEWPCGYRKFLQLDVELAQAHGLEVPLVDGRVEQHGELRFVRVLPWDERRVVVEDTYASSSDVLPGPEVLRERVRAYLAQRGLEVRAVHRETRAVLPIPLGGEAPSIDRPIVGAAAGLFDATSGLALPHAAVLADELAARRDLDAASLTAWLAGHVRAQWKQQAFNRRMNRRLVREGAGSPLVGRFFEGRLTLLDRLRA